MSEQDEKIRVEDKRHFDPDGTRRKEEKSEAMDAESSGKMEDKDAESDEKPKLKREQSTAERQAPGAEEAAPEVDFKMFILSLATQAMIHLGALREPGGGEGAVDVASAKQLIDIISMLREKTRGNLDADEITLIENILFDLRLQYVDRVKQS